MEDKSLFYKFLLDDHFEFCHEDCVLKEFSRMSLTDLIEKSQTMGASEIRAAIRQHEECLMNYRQKFAS